jgi:methionyl aminopeptidase
MKEATTLSTPAEPQPRVVQREPSERGIKFHGPEGFEGMRKAGRLAAEVLDFITPHVEPGVTTDTLDRLCHGFIVAHDAIPAPLNYRGFPRSICTSINHVVCHGIPGDRRLIEGDIINIDITVILDGWHGDTSRMFLVGDKVPLKARRLVDLTYEAMMLGIAQVKPGLRTGAIGHAIQSFVESQRCSVVRDFCGHGIGRIFHDAPSILHFGSAEEGPVLQPGMFFTVEPMVNAGRWEVKILADGWTAVTKDRSLSAQFEHTVGVTETGHEIFTLSPKGWTRPPYL